MTADGLTEPANTALLKVSLNKSGLSQLHACSENTMNCLVLPTILPFNVLQSAYQPKDRFTHSDMVTIYVPDKIACLDLGIILDGWDEVEYMVGQAQFDTLKPSACG
jgi:hypothetical protein